MTRPIVPVEVGQLRRDPDPRMNGRMVRVIEVGVEPVYWFGCADAAALVEPAIGGRKTRILLRRLERWEVVL